MFELLTKRKHFWQEGILTAVGGARAVRFPEKAPNLYLPNTVVVYALSGGVHRDSSGVHLPGLPVWHAFAAPMNIVFYGLLFFAILKGVVAAPSERCPHLNR
jgi:hypothetical protein